MNPEIDPWLDPDLARYAKYITAEERRDPEVIALFKGRKPKNIAAFHSRNPRARWYCERIGSPPKPLQYEAVQKWQHRDDDGEAVLSSGIVAVGGCSKGKTTAAMHRLLRGVGELYWDGEEVLCIGPEDLNSIPGKVLDGSLPAYMEELKAAQVLLIDDWDKARLTPRVASELYSLVEYRLRESEQPLFITQNTRTEDGFLRLFGGKDDEKKMGLSIYSRLLEACQYIDFDA